jgi:SPASM domain peptide maturase of grasp-with-spasm system
VSAPVLRLYAQCVPVRGARRSTICDLQRGTYRLIPNGLFDVLTLHRGKTADEVKAAYAPDEADTIDAYFRFVVENEMGFWTETPERFPDLALSWDAAERITNAVIDVGRSSAHDFASLFRQLDGLGCRHVQVRWFAPVSPGEVDAALAGASRGRQRSVEALVPWSAEWTDDACIALCGGHPRLMTLFVHSAPQARVADGPVHVRIRFRTERVTGQDHCGQVHPMYFTPAIGHFTESQGHNTCLNRKMSVDEHGEIRNCPSMPRSFGNARGTTLEAALMEPGFTDAWKVTKDQVEVCRDCEFRHVCTDCRAFTRDAANPLSKPARCAYDPYTATWPGLGDAPASVGVHAPADASASAHASASAAAAA